MGARPPSWDEPQNPLDPIDPIDPSEPPPTASPVPQSQGRPQRSPLRGFARIIGMLVVVGAIGGGVFLYKKLQPSPVQILNGFDVPVSVTIDEGGDTTTLTIPRRGRMTETLAGEVTLTVETSTGVHLSQETIDVFRGTDLVVYNILGAAAVFLEEVVYYSDGPPPGLDPAGGVQNLSGNTFYQKGGVEFVFELPPVEIEIETSASQVSRWHFGYIGDGSWMVAANSLNSIGRYDEARRIVEGVLSYDPQNTVAASFLNFQGGQAMPQAPQVPQPPEPAQPPPGK